MNSLFRNESKHRASDLIRDAVSATRAIWGDVPDLGMVTFMDRDKVKRLFSGREESWGWCYLKAGFEREGETKGGLAALRWRPAKMPEAKQPLPLAPWLSKGAIAKCPN